MSPRQDYIIIFSNMVHNDLVTNNIDYEWVLNNNDSEMAKWSVWGLEEEQNK